jgi:hypothetical protein
MVFVEGDNYRALRRPGDDPAQFRSVVRPIQQLQPQPPQTVLHRYRGSDFTGSTWPDSIGSADLTVTGASSATLGPNDADAVSFDGVDDNAESTLAGGNGPERTPNNLTFGIAMAFEATAESNTDLWGVFDGSNSFQINDKAVRDGTIGEAQIVLNEPNNTIRVESTVDVFDQTVKLLVINKNGSTASDIEFFLAGNSTSSPIGTAVRTSGTFDEVGYSMSDPLTIGGVQETGTVGNFKTATISHLEFNSAPYSSQDMSELVTRVDAI